MKKSELLARITALEAEVAALRMAVNVLSVRAPMPVTPLTDPSRLPIAPNYPLMPWWQQTWCDCTSKGEYCPAEAVV